MTWRWLGGAALARARDRAAEAARGALITLRAHPRHLVLGALVAGLLAAALAPQLVLLLALAAAALAGRPALALLAATTLLAGAIGAQARLQALECTQLPPLLGRFYNDESQRVCKKCGARFS